MKATSSSSVLESVRALVEENLALQAEVERIHGVLTALGVPLGALKRGAKAAGAKNPTTKKRGRPAGSKNAVKAAPVAGAKKRGRPPGSKNKPKTSLKTAAAAPKKRGRPVGSKNTPKAEVAVKRGPGRPKKVVAEAAPVKRGPGRPKKVVTAPPVVAKKKVKAAAVAAAPDGTVKRGRGRPKGSKNAPKAEAPAVSAAPVAKRGPGRPKSAKAAAEAADPKGETMTVNSGRVRGSGLTNEAESLVS